MSLFFLVFFSMGSVFVGLIVRESWAGLRSWAWSRTDCEVIRSEVRQNNGHNGRGRNAGNFFVDVEYRYRSGGNVFVSNRVKFGQASFGDYSQAERLAQLYPSGSHSICYVNPSAPDEAVLQRGNLLLPLLVLFPLIFVAIGAGGIYTAWRPGLRQRVVARPISDRAAGAYGPRFVMVFFGIFAALGVLVFFLVFVRPVSKILSARQWAAVPCTVISSEVRSHSGDKGTTYSVNVFYRYVVNDHEYRANRYDFMGGSSSGYAHKAAIVARYPPGSQAQCYVNPADPTQAVLQRDFTPGMWVGLLPLIFVALGLAGVISARRKRAALMGSGLSAQAAQLGMAPGDSIPHFDIPVTGAPLDLKPQAGPLKKLLAGLALALFWNGIISVFVVQAVRNWRSGPFEWFLAVFLIPFVLVGLGLVGLVIYYFLGLFNPRAHLVVTPGTGRLGESLRVEWEISGRVAALRKLSVRLEGREEVSYQQGDNTSTARSIFADLDIATQTEWRDMRSGSASVTIPVHLMHSFVGSHNKILWSIRVKGDIPHWPDLNEEFGLTVLPSGLSTRENS